MTDDPFDALAALERRRVLVALLDHNPQDALVASGEGDGAAIARRHVHLPELEDHGFVSWDRDEGIVTKGPRFDEIRPVVELLDDRGDALPLEWV